MSGGWKAAVAVGFPRPSVGSAANWFNLFFPASGLLMTLARNCADSSPTASSAPEAMLPGITGSQSLQDHDGENPTPDFANILVVVCHPPMMELVILLAVAA